MDRGCRQREELLPLLHWLAAPCGAAVEPQPATGYVVHVYPGRANFGFKSPLDAYDSRKSKGTLPVEVDHEEHDGGRLLARFGCLRGELGTWQNLADEEKKIWKEAGHHDRQSLIAILMVQFNPAGHVSWAWIFRTTSKPLPSPNKQACKGSGGGLRSTHTTPTTNCTTR